MPPKRISTLLITGQNNHDWQRTAPFFKQLLENTGRFSVTLSENPDHALGDPELGQIYDLVVLDYNGPLFSDLAKSYFELAVHHGTGVCVIHAANNAFDGWVEYEKMVGLLWRKGSAHGQFHEFDVTITEQGREHPVTRGMKNFTTTDELYHGLVVPFNTPINVIATAFSDPQFGGTGQDEPIMVTTQYGQGRVFHMILGHVWPCDAQQPDPDYLGHTMLALENPGFQAGLTRGCEWAATDKVTLPAEVQTSVTPTAPAPQAG